MSMLKLVGIVRTRQNSDFRSQREVNILPDAVIEEYTASRKNSWHELNQMYTISIHILLLK